MASSVASFSSEISSVSSDILVMYNKFLKWYKDQQFSNSTASVAHTGTSFVGLTQSSSPGPWIFYSGATDHITGNKSLFSSLSSTNPLHWLMVLESHLMVLALLNFSLL